MTIKETVKWFIEKTVGTHGGKSSDYFCGMTNNTARRQKEHGASALLATTKCSDKDCARDLMWALVDAGFDVDKDVMSGQDDSIHVYVYKKTPTTVQKLSRTVTISFQNNWYSEAHLDLLPDTKGIYCCFSCDKKLVDNHFQHCEPLYIGMTTDSFKSRINDHKNKDHGDWKKNLGNDKQLVYAIAEYDDDILQTIEAALIRENHTPKNSEYSKGYQGEYHTITVNCQGPKGGLKDSVTATFVGLLK